MGASWSKKSSRKKNKNRSRRSLIVSDRVMGDNEDENVRMISQASYDQAQINKLRRELEESPQEFVINNLVMAMMFFEHYEREKQKSMTSSRTTMQKELNPMLLRDETIECILPDVIFESVNKNIKFSFVHGSKKNKSEPLIPKRYYVVNDNIEVLESSNIPQYSAIDKPSYQVQVEESKRSGFVKLRCVDKELRQTKKGDCSEQNNGLVKEPVAGPSSSDDPEYIYEYSRITKVNTPKPLDIINFERRDTLPETCFTMKQIKKIFEVPDSDSEQEFEEEEPIEPKDLFEKIWYISSKGFMNHFQNAVFPNSLGKALRFDESEIESAKAIPGKIFCNQFDEDFNDPLPCEILPCVAIEWPAVQAFEFHNRSERPKMWDKFQIEYQWPSDNMIKDIRGFKCVLIPRGYIQKRGENSDSDIEWEIGFPRAERYLDTRMTHAQMKAFLVMLTIFKTYIQPKTKHHGLLIEHIRHFMYWECEANPRDWPEHKLGTKILKVLKHFHDKLSLSQLPDFFIKKKNMFENVPNPYLKHAQKTFHDILEAPAIYLLAALRNISYTNPKFYPKFDFKKLHMILTSDPKEAIALINLDALNIIPPNINPKKRVYQNLEGDKNHKTEIAWRIRQEKANRERFLKRRREKEEREKNLREERKGSVDSVDLGWQCEKRFDVIKCREMLILFIRYFIEIARKSRKLATQKQALLYLKQAYYLVKILEDYSGLHEDAKELSEIITKEEEICKKLSAQEDYEMPPSTPMRNSLQFNWELTQQVKGNNINLSNLNKTYHNTSVKPSTSFTKMKTVGNLKTRTTSMKMANGFTSSNEELRRPIELTTTGRKSVGFSETVELRM